MEATNHKSPSLGTLAGRIARTGAGTLRNRSELLAVEWQAEKVRLTELVVWGVGLVFLGMTGLVLLTGIVIFLFRPEYRIYAAAGFAVIYVAGAVLSWSSLRTLLKEEPFADSLDQARKDAAWLASFK